MFFKISNKMPIMACLAISVFLMAFSLNAQFSDWQSVQKIVTGVEPHFIIHDSLGKKLHVFCTGADLDWSGTENKGDSKPSWCMIDLNCKTLKSEEIMEFDFASFNIYGFRPAYDVKARKVFIPNGNIVTVCNLDDYSVIEKIDAGSTVAAVGVLNDMMCVSVNPTYGEKGSILLYKAGKKVAEFEAGLNTMDVKFLDDNTIAYICNGDYSADNGYYKELVFDFDYYVTNETEVYVGKAPNFLGVTTYDTNFGVFNLPVTVANASHNLHFYNALFDFNFDVYTGTNGWDGPRQVYADVEDEESEGFFVTNYSSDFRIIGGDDGPEVTSIVPTAGRPEGIVGVDNKIFVAIQLDAFYSPMNIVEVFEKQEIQTEEYSYKKVENSKANNIIVPVNDMFYTINPAVGINKITSDGTTYTSKKIFDLNIKTSLKPIFVPETNYVMIADDSKLYVYKITDSEEVKIIDEVDLTFAPTRLEYSKTITESGDMMILAAVTNKDYFFKSAYMYDVSVFSELTDNEYNNADFEFYDDIYNANVSAVDTIGVVTIFDDKGTIFKTFEGMSSETDITIIDSLLYITDYKNQTMQTVNMNTLDMVSEVHIPFPMGEVASTTGWKYFKHIESSAYSDELAYMINGNLCFYSLDKQYFTDMLAMSVNPLNDAALIETEDLHLIGAVTDDETIIYGRGMYVAVIDDVQSDIAQIKMYPNPVVNTATVELSLNSLTAGAVNYQVLASNGQVVGAGKANMAANMSFKLSVDEMNLVSGAYFLRIDTGNTVKLVPFLVQK